MRIREQLNAAASVPEVPFWAQLVGNLSMLGFKVIPEDLWDEVGAAFVKSCENDGLPNVDQRIAGWDWHTNHTRSCSHEVWQNDVFNGYPQGANIWVIPVDELVCMAFDDNEAMDFVTLYRATFVGTEQEMRASLPTFLQKASKNLTA